MDPEGLGEACAVPALHHGGQPLPLPPHPAEIPGQLQRRLLQAVHFGGMDRRQGAGVRLLRPPAGRAARSGGRAGGVRHLRGLRHRQSMFLRPLGTKGGRVVQSEGILLRFQTYRRPTDGPGVCGGAGQAGRQPPAALRGGGPLRRQLYHRPAPGGLLRHQGQQRRPLGHPRHRRSVETRAHRDMRGLRGLSAGDGAVPLERGEHRAGRPP